LEDNEKSDALDANGQSIEKGSVVKYINTGTVGYVEDIRSDEDGTWILIDTTDLYYLTDYIELSSEEFIKKRVPKKEEYEKEYKYAEEDMESFGSELSSQATGGG